MVRRITSAADKDKNILFTPAPPFSPLPNLSGRAERDAVAHHLTETNPERQMWEVRYVM